MRILEDAEKIKKCQIRLKSKFFFGADKKPKPLLTWKSPAGKFPYEVNYISRFNMWSCYMENPHKTQRHWNGFGVGEPKPTKAVAIDLAISFSIDGTDRGQAGAFVEGPNGETWICHTGNVYVGKDYFWEKYDGKQIDATYSDGEEVKLAVVANLDSDSCLSEVAHFVKEVNKYKAIKKIEKKRAKANK